jgi:hypothetical protein
LSLSSTGAFWPVASETCKHGSVVSSKGARVHHARTCQVPACVTWRCWRLPRKAPAQASGGRAAGLAQTGPRCRE